MSKDCSGGVSKLWKFFTGRRPPFEYCCDKHDKAYREGGTAFTRYLADKRMRRCIEGSGYPILAAVMYYAVRWFGWIFWSK